MDDDPAKLLIIILILIVLTIMNAFFSAVEVAFVSMNKSKLKKYLDRGDKRAILLEKINTEQTKFLSTIQLAITLAGFSASAIAGFMLSPYVVSIFDKYLIYINEIVAMIIVTIILVYLTIVFVDFYPKRVALRRSEKFAMKSASIIYFIMVILTPFVKLITASTALLLKIFGMNKPDENEGISEDEIRSLIVTGHTEGLITEDERQMFESIFKFDDLNADAIMTPRNNVYAINIDKPIQDNLDIIIEQGYSRIPIYQRDIDNIIGVLYIKDLLKEAKDKGFENIEISSIMRKPYFVPKYMKIDILFKNMKATSNQMAVLIDEYGGSVGIVTIEDLVEEIVGNIYDEYDEVDNTVQLIDNNTYLIDGGIQIQDLNRRLRLDIDEKNDEYDTLGGLIINLIGYIPSAAFKDEIEHLNLKFKIHKSNSNRIEQVFLTIKPIVLDEDDKNNQES